MFPASAFKRAGKRPCAAAVHLQPVRKVVAKLGVSCYLLTRAQAPQLSLFDLPSKKSHKLSDAMNALNDRYGEFVVTPTLMMGIGGANSGPDCVWQCEGVGGFV